MGSMTLIDTVYLVHPISCSLMKHVSVKILPVLNSTVTCTAQRARASRRTGGELIMWKMRGWKASKEIGLGADEGCPPCTHRSWPNWEKTSAVVLRFVCQVSPLCHRLFHNSVSPSSVSHTSSCRLTCCSPAFFIPIKQIHKTIAH